MLIGGNEEIQNSVVNILRCRASCKGCNYKVADVLSSAIDEEREQISGKSHPVRERAVKFDKWKIHNIFSEGNGVIIDNPKNSELIRKADVIIVLAGNDKAKDNIHKSIGKDTPKPLYKDGALVVHVGDRFEKLKDVREKLADIEDKNFLVPTVNINNCQRGHSADVPPGEGDARSRKPFKSELVLRHLNEALCLNRQGVQFTDKFFAGRVLPPWRTEMRDLYADLSSSDKQKMMSIDEMRKMFTSNEFLKSLEPGPTAIGIYPTLEQYIFGPWSSGVNGKSRIECIKNVDPELYDMFWDELSWINGHQEFLNKSDAANPHPKTGVCPLYKERLSSPASSINGECDTELRSFIESWGQALDDLSLIEQGYGQQNMTKDAPTDRILTLVRSKCREDLAQKAALDITMNHDGGKMSVPEVQAIIRKQFATALNLPGIEVAKDSEDFMPLGCGMVYSTNILSSIMNIEAIASVATDFAKGLNLANQLYKLSNECGEGEISYDECCKIFDRSARHILKGDKRPFDARFRSAVAEYMGSGWGEDNDLDDLSDWMHGKKNKKFSEITISLALCDDAVALVPELNLSAYELLGHLTFIKHLVDQGYIVLN